MDYITPLTDKQVFKPQLIHSFSHEKILLASLYTYYPKCDGLIHI